MAARRSGALRAPRRRTSPPRLTILRYATDAPASAGSVATSARVVAAMLCLEEGIIPETVGTATPDPGLPPCTIATEIRAPRSSSVLLLAESFGGRCAAMVMS